MRPDRSVTTRTIPDHLRPSPPAAPSPSHPQPSQRAQPDCCSSLVMTGLHTHTDTHTQHSHRDFAHTAWWQPAARALADTGGRQRFLPRCHVAPPACQRPKSTAAKVAGRTSIAVRSRGVERDKPETRGRSLVENSKLQAVQGSSSRGVRVWWRKRRALRPRILK